MEIGPDIEIAASGSHHPAAVQLCYSPTALLDSRRHPFESTINKHPPSSSSIHSVDDPERSGLGWRDVVMAYRTLGVVFGGLVTSPLYVYPSMKLRSPSEADYLGIYCIIFWTLTLIGVVKYACIALRADDNGEGGTFALYSLLCRHTNVGHHPCRYFDSSTYSEQHRGTEAHKKLVRLFEGSVLVRRVVLFISMLGMCMLIGDGILTPSISVLSAMDGLRGPVPSISRAVVKALSATVLIFLFLVQRFGTARVAFLFSPIMAAWTFTTAAIGIYSISCHYPHIFKALSPHHAVSFFIRNGKEGWLLLGGTVLCITGAESMFADLGHFNRASIQIAFLLTIYPSLILTYGGQTAYLIKNLNDHGEGFYKFVPTAVYWPMFVIATLAAIVASQSLISATYSVIKQSVGLGYFPRVTVVHTSKHQEGEVYSPEVNYTLMVLCVGVTLGFGDGADIGNAFGVVVILVMLITTILLTLVMVMIWKTPLMLVLLYLVAFLVLEGAYVSAVFTKIPEGGWIPFVISLILALIMFSWYYGRQKKVDHEKGHQITMESLRRLLSQPDICRVPGLCFFYSNIYPGLPPILGHYLKNMRSLHEVTVFMTFRYSMIPKVEPDKKIVVQGLGFKGIYSCIVQYGYADSLSLEDSKLLNDVIESLRLHMQSNSHAGPTMSVSSQEEMMALEQARNAGVVHVLGKTSFKISKRTNWLDKFLLSFYSFLHAICRSALPSLGIPLSECMEIGMLYEG